MTEHDQAVLDDIAAAAEAAQPGVKRKFLRITSTMRLDWPEHNFVLHALDSQKTNDFANPEELPEGILEHLKGWFRSGHVKVYVITELEDGTVTSADHTPTDDELAEDDEPIQDQPPAPAPAPAPAESAASAPAEPALAATPGSHSDSSADASPPKAETPAS